MKKKIIAMVLAFAVYDCWPQTEVRDWENPAVLGINKLPYHATLQLPSKWKDCKEIISLDGQWLFRWSKDPESRPMGFEREEYDVSGYRSGHQYGYEQFYPGGRHRQGHYRHYRR